MFKIQSRIKTLEPDGKKIVYFEIGDLDLPPPRNIIDAVIKALKNSAFNL